eukprot:3198899-Prymnesium_polylepis.1
MEAQRALHAALRDEALLRERRGGDEPPPQPDVPKGVALLDAPAYGALLPDEQLELNLFGFKLSCKTRAVVRAAAPPRFALVLRCEAHAPPVLLADAAVNREG